MWAPSLLQWSDIITHVIQQEPEYLDLDAPAIRRRHSSLSATRPRNLPPQLSPTKVVPSSILTRAAELAKAGATAAKEEVKAGVDFVKDEAISSSASNPALAADALASRTEGASPPPVEHANGELFHRYIRRHSG